MSYLHCSRKSNTVKKRKKEIENKYYERLKAGKVTLPLYMFRYVDYSRHGVTLCFLI